MKRILSLFMSLVLAVGVLSSIPLLDDYEISGIDGVTAFAAEEQYTFTTVKGTTTKTYFSDYDVTINVFGRDGCYNTISVISRIIALGIDEMQGVKVNFIDVNQNSKEAVKAFSEQFEASAVDYCYDTSNNANSVMWDYANTIGSSGSVTLPVVAFINSDSTIRKVTTGTFTDSYLLGIVNNDENIDKTITFKIKGVDNYTYANSVLQQMNVLRASLGLEALVMEEELLAVAMQRAAEIAIYYSHTRPDDLSCFSFSVAGNTFGENIAIGYTSPEGVMNGWTNSSGHYANMINANFNAVGVGCFEASDGTLCWVQYFSGGSTPQNVQKSGTVKSTHTINAKNKNLDLSIESSCYDPSVAKKGDEISFDVVNRNAGFSYQTQTVSSGFNFKSLDTDIIDVNSSGVGEVVGEGTAEIKATLKDDVNFSLENKITIGHKHNYLYYFSNDDATCVSDGTKTAYCNYTGCEEKHTVKDEGTRLDHQYTWVTVKKATVYSAGKKQKECSVCGRVAKTSTIAQLKCSKPTLKAVSNTTSGMKITWSKVKGGDSYRVYRKTKGGSWKYLDSTKNGYFTDTTAKTGTTYYYTVRAKNEAGLSSYNTKGLSIKYVAAPKLSKVQNITGGLKVTWSKVSGADGYYVYRKLYGSDSWTRIATVKGGSTVTYKDTKVSKGKVYVYTVKAYDGSAKSAHNSTGIKLRYLATPTLKSVTSTTSGVKFTWRKVTGAEGYYVYRKTTGGWKRIATVEGKTHFLDKTAKKGTTYTYTVKAFKGNNWSSYNTKGLTIKDKY